jgi:formate dehydrogenase subunit gamma
MAAPTAPRPTSQDEPRPSRSEGIQRYGYLERILHWFVGITFVYLLLSGFALGYPRMAWLYGVLGGGQTVRVLHPIVGIAMTVGVVVMLVMWAGENKLTRRDAEWVRRLPEYAKTGHTGLDLGKYNPGQKGFFWGMVLLTIGLLVTGIPLWFPELGWSLGLLQVMRLLHHVLFLGFVAAFIVHVYLSTVALPGTISAMTTGRVSRAWAANHHPAWFREQDRAQRQAEVGSRTATGDGEGSATTGDGPP